jgi:hypothetical protein
MSAALDRTALAALVLATSACGKDLMTPAGVRIPSDPGPVVVTDRVRYSWLQNDSVRFVITNSGDVPVFILGCIPFVYQRFVNGAWSTVVDFPAVGCPPPPRLTTADTVRGSFPLSLYYFPDQGYYRFILAAFRDSALTNLWPEAHRVSPTFWVGP